MVVRVVSSIVEMELSTIRTGNAHSQCQDRDTPTQTSGKTTGYSADAL